MFFTPKEAIPESLGFTTFGSTHLIRLALLTAFCVTVILIYQKLSADKQEESIIHTKRMQYYVRKRA